MGAVVENELWLRRFHRAPAAHTRLICFPHAGGSASYYHALSEALLPEVELSAIQYPGRQERYDEEPIRDIRTLASRVAAALTSTFARESAQDTRPMLFFGHSMGAVVAFEVALLLQAQGAGPAALVASARRAPSCLRGNEVAHLRDDPGLIDKLKESGGTDSSVLENPDLMDLILPIVRADYQAIETYVHRPGPKLDCPILAVIGDDDPGVTEEEAAAWQRHTNGGFELKVFKGGHFYLNEHLAELADLVRDRAVVRG